MKLLKKLLLINWHYFSHQMIEFEQLNYMTGVNASGKSTIIDALQLVLFGDTAGRYFNKSASGKSARTFEADSKEDAELIATADLLSLKPIIYAANMDEDGFADKDSNKYYKLVADLAAKEGAEVLPICAKLEQDIAELDGDDRAMFLEELGIEKSGLDRLIQCSYTLLGLISFLTYGEDECRAWTIVKGTKAPQAAGKIHSDIERGFIRAETINFSEMIACGSVAAAKEKGLLRSEGKDYVVKDGDMIYFRFNV